LLQWWAVVADLNFILQTTSNALAAPPAPIKSPDVDEPRAPLAGAAPGGGDAYWKGGQYVDKDGAPVASLKPQSQTTGGGNDLATKFAILDQARQGKFNYTPPTPTEAPVTLSGTLGNFGARANEAIASALGAPVDLVTGIVNNFATPERARNFIEGRGNAPL